MRKQPLTFQTTSVQDDNGKHLYTELGCYINTIDNSGDFIPTDLTISLKADGDRCEKKTSGTHTKCGYAANGWHLGIKDRVAGSQHLTKAVQIVGVTVVDGVVSYEKIEDIANDGKSIDDQNQVVMSQYLTLQYNPINSGVAVQHTIPNKIITDYPQYEYYGVLWLSNLADVTSKLEAGDGCKFYTIPDGSGFIEYFPKTLFSNPDESMKESVVHDFTTVSNITQILHMVAGTYYLSSTVLMGTNDILFDCSSGSIYIKTKTGDQYIQQNNTGNVSCTGTSETNKIIFTSKNDDAHGERITTAPASTGSPATGDQVRNYLTLVNPSDYTVAAIPASATLSYAEFWYWYPVASNSQFFNGAITFGGNGVQQTNGTLNLSHIKFKYCKAGGSSTGFIAPWCGLGYGSGYQILSQTIDNVSIDNTNSMVTASSYYSDCIGACATTCVISNCFINAVGAAGCAAIGIECFATNRASTSFTFYNNCFISNSMPSLFSSGYYTHVPTTFIVKNCLVQGFTRMGLCPSGMILTSLINNVIVNVSNFNAGGPFTVTSHTYNGYYNVSSIGYTLDATEFTADPNIGVLPVGATIDTTKCYTPDGYAIKNLASYENKGSASFSALGIDATDYSATGQQYRAGDIVTPGYMYYLSQEISPTCWSFFAKYFNSNKVFSLTGPQDAPSIFEIPKNVDASTATLIEHGRRKTDFKIIQ